MPSTRRSPGIHIEKKQDGTARWYVFDRHPPFTEYRRGYAQSFVEAMSAAVAEADRWEPVGTSGAP